MGGENSGRSRPAGGSVDDHVRLQIKDLVAKELLEPPHGGFAVINWAGPPGAVRSARLRTEFAGRAAPSLEISWSGGAQQITLARSETQVGRAARFAFLCPVRGIRCTSLYFVDGRFASRQAHGLTYSGRRSGGRLGRALRRKAEIETELAGLRGQNGGRALRRRLGLQSELAAVNEALAGLLTAEVDRARRS